jgi:radical SAM protein with 4Fe4S-binding SPASM domain
MAGVGRRQVTVDARAPSCFFRSAAPDGQRKALVQITERCNLHCAHCFVSSTREGTDIALEDFESLLLPRLEKAHVTRLTLTGGEPFVHPEIISIVQSARGRDWAVGICTNATLISDEQISALREIGGVHVNVSFDGFRAASHGRFRGSPASFEASVETTRRLADAGLLQGLLSTPNALTTDEDYELLAEFGLATEAEYLLMNPLSAFGRGVKSKAKLEAAEETMREALRTVRSVAGDRIDVVPIRFPNDSKPLGGCIAGEIIYVFADGKVAVCPYLVFAARSPASQHSDSEFLVGNIFKEEIAEALDAYRFHQRYQVGANEDCGSCDLNPRCGKGCPAAVIAAGGRIGDRDDETCPIA